MLAKSSMILKTSPSNLHLQLQLMSGNMYVHIVHLLKNLSNAKIKRLLHWALPPELQSDESLNFVDEYESEKADIWFIGITALELAYGRIQVAEPLKLLDIASYISDVGMLPNTWEELKTATVEEELKKIIPQTRFLRFPTHKKVLPRFDEYFGNFVAMCLATNPQERPSTAAAIIS